jgi:hypothetical protein
MNVLFDLKRGGDIVISDFGGPLEVVDGSYYKFRDISIGFSLAPAFVKKISLRSAHVSLSGRNLIAFDNADRDPEMYYYYSDYLRSISLSLSASF